MRIVGGVGQGQLGSQIGENPAKLPSVRRDQTARVQHPEQPIGMVGERRQRIGVQ
jgi:hypothetical protein